MAQFTRGFFRSLLRTRSFASTRRPVRVVSSALHRPFSTTPSELSINRSQNSTLLITLTGDDTPGITAGFSRILHESGCELLDANQATIHGKLCLYFLLSMGPEQQKPLLSDLLWESKTFPKLDVKFEVMDDKTLEDQAPKSDVDEHVVTLIGKNVSFGAVASVTEQVAAHGFNVVTINQLSDISPSSLAWREMDTQAQGRVGLDSVKYAQKEGELFTSEDGVLDKKMWDSWAKKHPNVARTDRQLTRALEMRIRPDSSQAAGSAAQLQDTLLTLQTVLGCDVALQREAVVRRVKRLVVMDMDSTLIQQEVIDEIARGHGVYEKVAAVTHEAMEGGMDFNESLRIRCKELAGCPEKVLNDVYENIEYTPGAVPFVRELRRQGYKIGVLSGGFNAITQRVKEDLGLDFAFANDLEVVDGKLTGEVVGPIVNRERKRDLLESICQSERISTEQAIAVGDGANDLEMLRSAGLGIAFNAKPKVQEASKYTINTNRLDSILYLLGVRASDMSEESDPRITGLNFSRNR